MQIDLRQLIIHELRKAANQPAVGLVLAEAPQPIGTHERDLVGRLYRVFQHKNDRLHGRMSEPEDALFPGYFQLWREADGQPDAFLQFSRDTAQTLADALPEVPGAKGGYLVYAYFAVEGEDLLGIFLIRDTDGLVFERTPAGTILISPTTYLQIDRMAMAAIVYLDRLQRGNQRYVDLVKHAKSQAAVSDYFTDWLGLEATTSSKEQTTTFLQMVDELPLPLDSETGQPVPEPVFREQVMDFAASSAGKTVNLKAFDEAFYEDQGTVQQFVSNNGLSLDEEFRVDRATLKGYHSHRVGAQGFSLIFNRQHLLRHELEIDGDRIILHAPELVEQIRDVMEDI